MTKEIRSCWSDQKLLDDLALLDETAVLLADGENVALRVAAAAHLDSAEVASILDDVSALLDKPEVHVPWEANATPDPDPYGIGAIAPITRAKNSARRRRAAPGARRRASCVSRAVTGTP